MARQSRPWWRASRSMWYTTLAGVQTPLDVTDPKAEAAAWRALEAILAQAKGNAEPPRPVPDVVRDFLADAAGRVKPRTLKGYRWYGSLLATDYPDTPVTDLTADVLERKARRPGWSAATRNNYLSTAVTILHWARVTLDRPVKKPRKPSAGGKSVIPEPVYRRMLGHCKGDWYACVVFLWHTGARPSEASALDAEHVDWAERVVRLTDHKTADSTDDDRLIFLNDEAFEVLNWQREKYGMGPLFRSQRGARLSAQAFVMKFRALSRRCGQRVTAYGCRHSYITHALARGIPDTIVAALVGQKGTRMIDRNYRHVSAMGRELRDAAGRARKAG